MLEAAHLASPKTISEDLDAKAEAPVSEADPGRVAAVERAIEMVREELDDLKEAGGEKPSKP